MKWMTPNTLIRRLLFAVRGQAHRTPDTLTIYKNNSTYIPLFETLRRLPCVTKPHTGWTHIHAPEIYDSICYRILAYKLEAAGKLKQYEEERGYPCFQNWMKWQHNNN